MEAIESRRLDGVRGCLSERSLLLPGRPSVGTHAIKTANAKMAGHTYTVDEMWTPAHELAYGGRLSLLPIELITPQLVTAVNGEGQTVWEVAGERQQAQLLALMPDEKADEIRQAVADIGKLEDPQEDMVLAV